MFTAHALDDESFMDMCVDMYLSSPDVSGTESAEFLKNKITKALDIVIIMRRVGPKIRCKSISEVVQDADGARMALYTDGTVCIEAGRFEDLAPAQGGCVWARQNGQWGLLEVK